MCFATKKAVDESTFESAMDVHSCLPSLLSASSENVSGGSTDEDCRVRKLASFFEKVAFQPKMTSRGNEGAEGTTNSFAMLQKAEKVQLMRAMWQARGKSSSAGVPRSAQVIGDAKVATITGSPVPQKPGGSEDLQMDPSLSILTGEAMVEAIDVDIDATLPSEWWALVSRWVLGEHLDADETHAEANKTEDREQDLWGLIAADADAAASHVAAVLTAWAGPSGF
jgi:hypothetical protein